MKHSIKFQFIFLFIVAFFLLISSPAQGLPETDDDIEYKIEEIEYEIDTIIDEIRACKEDFYRVDKEISELETMDNIPHLEGVYSDWSYCNFGPRLTELKKQLDQLVNPSAKVKVSEEQGKKIEGLKIKLDELEKSNDNLVKRAKGFEARIKKLEGAAGDAVHSELASDINNIVKPALEKEFGELDARIIVDQEKDYDRFIQHLITIDYKVLDSKRLDDNWAQRTVKALGYGKVEGNSVRADGKKIDGIVANTFQAVASWPLISVVISVLRKKEKE